MASKRGKGSAQDTKKAKLKDLPVGKRAKVIKGGGSIGVIAISKPQP